MDVIIHAHEFDLNPDLEDYINRKISKLDRYMPGLDEVRVELSNDNRRDQGRPIVQITVRHRRGRILRAEDKRQNDFYAGFDSVLNKMYRQIRSFKGKRRRRGRAEEMAWFADAEPLPLEAEEPFEAEEAKTEIVRRKSIDLVPIDENEAMERIEEVDHDFYMFFNANTGQINVLYRREEGNYGLLEPIE